jgi:hypothetical protein
MTYYDLGKGALALRVRAKARGCFKTLVPNDNKVKGPGSLKNIMNNKFVYQLDKV